MATKEQTKDKTKTLDPGWTYSKTGFQPAGYTQKPNCQWNTNSHQAKPVKATYARTLWNGAVVFVCGSHRSPLEDYARPSTAQRLGGQGYVPTVISPHLQGPRYQEVDGAPEPFEHPAHTDYQPDAERPTCWCGATQDENKETWTGGKPLNTPR